MAHHERGHAPTHPACGKARIDREVVGGDIELQRRLTAAIKAGA